MKHNIFEMMTRHEVPYASKEVMNLFVAHVHHFDPHRSNQVCVPDIMYRRGYAPKNTLADVKTITVCPSRYGPARLQQRCGAVNARAALITGEYAAKAREGDRKYNGVAQGAQPGPLQQEMTSYGRIEGLVFGAYGEVSRDVDALVKLAATHGAPARWRDMGARNVMEARSTITQQWRRTLGVQGVRAHAALKRAVLRRVIGGDENAGGRRRNARYSAWRHARADYHRRHQPDGRGW